jgi:glycosyltransferase involved in cell wall biosynthesis
VAMLAPPWITVPPPGYGGIEAVVALLSDELVARGHDVTLFAAPGSHSTAKVVSPLATTHADQIGGSLWESDHVATTFDLVDQATADGRPFDLLHDHSGFTAAVMAARLSVPVVHTVHGPFNEETRPFYVRHGHKVRLVALSRYQREHAPPGVHVHDIVPNPVRVGDWPFCPVKDDYLLWMGRMDPAKGAQRAIAAARAAGVRLVLAGPVQPGQEQYFARDIEPHVDGVNVVYAGEVGGKRRKELFAYAKGFLMPIRWAEPFGMVIVEALACGTPVIAFPEGAASEIVVDGENGFLVADEHQMADAIRRLDTIDPLTCRQSAASRYDVGIVADGYEAVYRSAIGAPLEPLEPELEPEIVARRNAPLHHSHRVEPASSAHLALPGRSLRPPSSRRSRDTRS